MNGRSGHQHVRFELRPERHSGQHDLGQFQQSKNARPDDKGNQQPRGPVAGIAAKAISLCSRPGQTEQSHQKERQGRIAYSTARCIDMKKNDAKGRKQPRIIKGRIPGYGPSPVLRSGGRLSWHCRFNKTGL